MYRKKPTKQQWLLLSILAVTAVLGVLAAYALRKDVQKPGYAAAVAAAEQMQRCMDAVKAEKAALGIPLAEEDIFETGLIGEDYNFTTTTLGDIAAKRTTCDPNMAAFAVFLLQEAGLEKGDTLGCCFSGSFPGLNIAVLCACDALGIRPVYLASCGASTWGANNPELTFPEMAILLYEQGLISAPPALITPGGNDDVGGTADAEAFDEIFARVAALGYPVMTEPDLETNVLAKKALLDGEAISCFLSAGGSISATGTNLATDFLGQGLLEAQTVPVNRGSGLIERYLAEDMPVILLLNIRQLAAQYGFPFDPSAHAAIGSGSIYTETALYNPALWVCSGLLTAEMLIFCRKRRKNPKNA